ncbi:DUF397 domain-containing protein [Streptomyces palmae]|uniref:DUF397 domain-containing protein n=1 Tax=Streptomyces palmae TaxID=1701085 RepID=A0A4Z0H8Y7_9ACTN|nr:DUF397 domain-containing protein [Streptomyces palmae]TGB13338.1 DUF397 domain-containing protein [Streptomyces palmae]
MTTETNGRTGWRRSSFSGNGEGNLCVELRAADGVIRLRESDDPGITLAITRPVLLRFVRAAKVDRFDRLDGER